MSEIIVNYGTTVQDDMFAALPIHIIDGVLCNYTFIKKLDDGISYNNELGQLKEDSMRALGLGIHLVDIPNNGIENMKAALAKTHSLFATKSERTQVVLYRFERTEADDAIFYESLNITAESATPVDFFSLDIEPDLPFFGVPMEEMFEVPPEIINKVL